jgi:TonB family protein
MSSYELSRATGKNRFAAVGSDAMTPPLIRALRGFAITAVATFLFHPFVHAQAKDTPPKPDNTQEAAHGDTSDPLSGVDILSDTRGVNFTPYIRQILRKIFNAWLPLIPAEARPPQNAQAETKIRFSIAPSGKLLAMHLDASSRQEKFDRAAWGAITAFPQFPPLPEAFTGPLLELRVDFRVNIGPPKTKP